MNARPNASAPRQAAPLHFARIAAAALAVASLALTVSVSAALYKWTDANGRVVYSDQPPPANIKSEQLNTAAPPANPHAVREMAEQEAELKKRQADRVKQAENDAKSRGDAEKKNTACARAAGQIRELSASQVVVYGVNDRGERTVLDEQARVKERQRLEQWTKANCSR